MRQWAGYCSKPPCQRLIKTQNEKQQQKGAMGHWAPPAEHEESKVSGDMVKWGARGQHGSEPGLNINDLASKTQLFSQNP